MLLRLSFAFAAGREESLAWGLGTRLLASAPRRPFGVQLRNSWRIFGVGRTRNAPWPLRPSQDFSEPETNFSGKVFKLVNKTQFEALLQTQAAEVGCTALEKTSLTRNYYLVAELGEF